MEPMKNTQKRLRTELNKLYQHLDGINRIIKILTNLIYFPSPGSASGPIETFDDAPTLVSLGVHDYYPYVFFKMNIDFLEKRL
jgi:hypothetical protein